MHCECVRAHMFLEKDFQINFLTSKKDYTETIF